MNRGRGLKSRGMNDQKIEENVRHAAFEALSPAPMQCLPGLLHRRWALIIRRTFKSIFSAFDITNRLAIASAPAFTFGSWDYSTMIIRVALSIYQ